MAEDVLRVKLRVLERDGGDEVDEPREVREGRYSCRHRNWLATGMSPLRILVELAEEGLGGGVGHREEKQKAEMGKLKWERIAGAGIGLLAREAKARKWIGKGKVGFQRRVSRDERAEKRDSGV